MQIPEFEIVRIGTYGVHVDPRKAALTAPAPRQTWSFDYALKFYLEDLEGGIVIDGTRYPVAKDHFSCCKPNQTSRVILPYRAYILNISTRDPKLRAALDALPAFAHHPDMPQIVELCKKMIYVDHSGPLSARFEIFSYACAILHLLLRQQYTQTLGAAKDGTVRRHRQALVDADNYLQTHLEEEVDLEKLAQDSHLHPTYFHKLFTAAYGRTPAQQLMWHRIAKARGLLRNDDRPISEIARLCGFASQSYFCRKFKSIIKQTPSQYRSTIRNRRKKDS